MNGMNFGTAPGMMQNVQPAQVALMKQINEASFAMDDVLLFLDTHPTNTEALAYYKNVAAMRRSAIAAYERQFGPLLVDNVQGNTWTWETEFCPWEGGC